MSHTLGPWEFAEVTLANPGGDRLVRAGDGSVVAKVSRDCWDDRDANARLIAAAPELLAALKSLVAIIDKAGLLNLSNGVQLGQTSWYVKASDSRKWALVAIANAERLAPDEATEPQASKG